MRDEAVSDEREKNAIAIRHVDVNTILHEQRVYRVHTLFLHRKMQCSRLLVGDGIDINILM